MENVPTEKFGPGEIIFKEGDPSNSVYLIIDGKVEISRQRKGSLFILATQGKNTLFGEMALIDGKSRSATAKAIELTYCYKCSAIGILNELKKTDPEINHVMQQLAAIIRKNNDLKLTKKIKNKENQKDILFDENIKQPYLTKEEIINNQPFQNKVESLSPFIKSMYRVLMKIAFE